MDSSKSSYNLEIVWERVKYTTLSDRCLPSNFEGGRKTPCTRNERFCLNLFQGCGV